MKTVLSTAAIVLASASLTQAGGLDRSGQDVSAIFEDGNYAELSFGYVTPSVSGTLGPFSSGNIAPAYSLLGLAVKTQVSDQLSMALIFDQPFGAQVSYDEATYPGLFGTSAEVASTGITALVRYEFSDAFSVHGGIRMISGSGAVLLTAPAPYASTYSSGSATGYVVGGAFEKPEIAMRIALTYSSSVDVGMSGTVGDADVRLPQTLNLDFQTGIAADTLLFGTVRWADWTEAYVSDSLAGDLVTYDQDSISYTLGVGRKFSEQFSGAVSIDYEAAAGGLASNLSPTDGSIGITVGGTYSFADFDLTGGISYVQVGDATTELVGASFTGNSAIGVGLKVSRSF